MRHRDGSKMDPVMTDRCVNKGPKGRIQQIPITPETTYPVCFRKVGSSLPL